MFKVDVGVGNLDGGDLAAVQPDVDTRAAHSMLPESLMTQLRIEPQQQLGFILANGSRVKYGYGFARFSIGDYERPCPVIFGPHGNYLLGRVDAGGVQPGGGPGWRATAAGGVAVAGLGWDARNSMIVRDCSAGRAIHVHAAVIDTDMGCW